jgi:pimeloyl-ACP methyl ester carboxylesterase
MNGDVADVTIPLHDGRTLAACVYGEDNALPLLFFHGAPGARSLRWPSPLLDEFGVRQICFDRPGYGASTAHPGRTLATVAADTIELLDALDIDKCAAVGWSAGGRFAIALAALAPERVRALGLVAARGPLFEIPGELERMDSGERGLLELAASDSQALVDLLLPFYQSWVQDPSSFMSDALSPDREVMSDSEFGPTWHVSLREAFAQGAEAMAWDLISHYAPWPCDLEAVTAPTAVMRGGRDHVVGPESGSWFEHALPVLVNATWPDLGHLAILKGARRILATVLSLEDPPARV